MLSLFSTNSDKSGFRLQYMEVYNWGTFHDKIFKISPQGNNSLLTGANASGKSTYIDALLTLLVPVKKDRFYNQSSGVEKKGDRTEETYVCGHYGNIQEEGKSSSSTQMLRGKDTYSVILCSFSNTDQKVITLFQVRWFSNNELKRTYGIAHVPLEIEKDFSQFDGKGNWRKRLNKTYNLNSNKRKVEFIDGPTSYAERISHLLGMRSVKALSLFNQVVGVKVLEDLDEFIRTNMLEEQDAETEFIQLKESFLTLMDAKVNIEKAKEQISQLSPINDIAVKLDDIKTKLKQYNNSKEVGVYWFAKKSIEFLEAEFVKSNEKLEALNLELIDLRCKESEFKNQETDLTVQIKSDEVGTIIQNIKAEIGRLERSRNQRKNKFDQYNKLAESIGLKGDPSFENFAVNREKASLEKAALEAERKGKDENIRLSKNKRDDLKSQIEIGVDTIRALQKNKNNIAGREVEIRDEILEYIGATIEEIPFIGELIKVNDEEQEWETSIEKVLHNFALRLIIPEKYYAKVNEYVNRTNLKGRIIYQRYRGFTSLSNMANKNTLTNSLISKIEFKPNSSYTDWLEDVIINQYNYTCVDNMDELTLYETKSITKEGLIKFGEGKHEKDDRLHISRKENYVLGWDNKDKIRLLKKEIKELQEKEIAVAREISLIEKSVKALENQKESYSDLFKIFTKYDDIDWKTYAVLIQEKEENKLALEKTNNRVQALQKQLVDVQVKLKNITEVDIKSKDRSVFQLETNLKTISAALQKNKNIIFPIGTINTIDFESQYSELLEVEYSNLKSVQTDFQKELTKKLTDLERQKRNNEDSVRLKINAFKRPSGKITEKFLDWYSDVSRLPESTYLEFIGEYQTLLKQLVEDNLPRFEKRFNEYLQETITNKVGDFRMFFENWSDSIKENVSYLNESLKGIDYSSGAIKTYIQMVVSNRTNDVVNEFRTLLNNAIPNIKELDASIDERKNHFYNNIEPLFSKLDKEEWRKKVMDVRSWYNYKAEEFYRSTDVKYKTHEGMGSGSGGEKAKLTYTILGSAIAYQFGLTKEGLQSNSFRFVAIDEAFRALDETNSRYLISLCKQLHLQLLVVTPSDNIHIVENDISFVHFIERKEDKYSWLYDMPIAQFQDEKANFVTQ